ncbi:MAG: ornithine acetyltransferase [Sulfobacillus benefaciens]|uniref:Arginine biosynthesis bifunctional protein ArgJ n=1 Tax=Sulfobacillus benefaciens TaxID=453960 RepID=A0A2T2XM43_9FIRM|nr:MAG: ornithine acetyltransferase [Sulfobacillus benefaciens]
MALVEGNVSFPQGFEAYGVNAGLRKGMLDMALIWSKQPATFSGTFTTNSAKAAPVVITQSVAERGLCQAIVVNSTNANAMTGDQGYQDAVSMQTQVAQGLDLPPGLVAVASTGVIGVPLPMHLIQSGIAALVNACHSPEIPGDGIAASQAILTTDTVAKTHGVMVTLSSGTVRIGMMAKGSGMIHPQMATMLVFITTDAKVSKSVLDDLVRRGVEQSFHRISVDGDPSTNDMVLCLANGASGVEIRSADDERIFGQALVALMQYGARQIAKDGEGATHLLTVKVRGGVNESDAALKARTAVRSSLVKSAVYGADPNWGRVIAAVGSVGLEFDPGVVDLTMNGMPLLQSGQPVAFDEQRAKDLMGQEEVVFDVDLHLGDARAEAWGCDLTERYVEINARYRT